jgi:hypothetical protein
VLLLICITVTVLLTYKNYSTENLQRLFGPISRSGNFCGLGNMQGYPYLYYTNLTSRSLSDIENSGVCVKECPTRDIGYLCNEPNCTYWYIL